MSEFFSAHFFEALTTAIINGLKVVVAMLVVGGIFTVASGGPAALGWKKNPADHH